MQELRLHPDCAPGPIERVMATIASRAEGCSALFSLDGAIDQIKVPAPAVGVRTDNLWQTTCFEIFWQGEGESAYREFNLSPSTRWAAYDFDDFRLNGRDAGPVEVVIGCTREKQSLELLVDITSALPLPAAVALNAIVEDLDGNMQYWALAFPEGKPEFHSEACRRLKLEARP